MASSQNSQIFIQCCPLLDITGTTSAEELKKFHIDANSAALCTPENKGIFSHLESKPDVTYTPGGSGLNTARVAQWMSQAAKGSFVTYVGCVADDKHGNLLKQAAEKDGVDMALEFTDKEATGTCAVCITGKERSLVANLGAANCLSAAHMECPAVKEVATHARLLYTTAYAVPLNTAVLDKVVSQSRSSPSPKTLLAFALSSVEFLDNYGENVVDLLCSMDIVFCNEDELRRLALILQVITDDLQNETNVAKAVLEAMPYDNHDVRRIIVTRGSRSAIYVSAAGDSGEVPTLPLPDPSSHFHCKTGAGDAFAGGFLAALAKGKAMDECCKWGHFAATYAIQNGVTLLDASADRDAVTILGKWQ